jgi:uncharacterized Fe-S cluster-containing radical SAM superfamily protein
MCRALHQSIKVSNFAMRVDSEALAEKYRAATLNLDTKQLLITNFRGTQQERDLSEPANCGGFGRIRHFRRTTSPLWPSNPLPIDPASAALGLGRQEQIRAEVFQNAACNWRCWYCFVPFNLLSANHRHSAWITPSQLMDAFLNESERPCVIDLSGGQPELVPEWVLWMIEELDLRKLRGQVYLWSDDNLSCDYFWRYLSADQQRLIATYPYYGRVACFKGFDEESFKFNTSAEGHWFDRQFELMSRLLRAGLDMYGYVTLTTPILTGIRDQMRRFVDKLQAIDAQLPLRTVPLEIQEFSPVTARMNHAHRDALQNQYDALEEWQRELSNRFPSNVRNLPITEIRFNQHAA